MNGTESGPCVYCGCSTIRKDKYGEFACVSCVKSMGGKVSGTFPETVANSW